ncbi:MAG: APC family permease [Fervidicoccaceae archaeon]
MRLTEEVFVRRASGLVRELSWLDVALWVLATPAASGITYYSVKILGDPSCYGGSIVLSFALAGLMFLPLVVAFALIAASFPRSSSLYVFVSRAIHPVLGFLPFWYFVIGGGAAMASGFLAFIGIKALSGPLTVAAAATGSPSMLRLAESLVEPRNQLVVAIVVVLVVWALNYLGMRVIKWTMRVLVVLPLAATLTAMLVLAAAEPGAGQRSFDAVFGSGAASSVLSTAVEGRGGVEPLSPVGLLAGSYGMLLWTLWAFTGVEIVTFVGSEVKDPSRSYFRGYLTGFVIVTLVYLTLPYLAQRAFGYDFLASYAYLKSEYPDVLERILGVPPPDPSIPFYASMLLGSPAVAVTLGACFVLWYLNTIIPIWVGGVRGFFSMAFDRMLPERLASVSPRWAAPTWANHVIAIMALFGALMTYMENMGYGAAAALISFMDFSVLFFVWPVGLALMLMPHWRPDLFDKVVLPSRRLCTVVGALVFALGWFFMILTAYSDPAIVLVNVVVGTAGLLIFAYMSQKNRERGIEPSRVFAQIPPA